MADAKPVRVLVLGFGALGTLYGFLLARGGAEVYAVARSNADSLLSRGIDIQSEKYGFHPGFKPKGVFRTADECQAEGALRPFDFVLCTVKICPEQRQTGHWIRDYLPPAQGKRRAELPTVVFVENGIGIEEEPYETLCMPKDRLDARAGALISCCAWLGATLTNGGTTVEHAALEKLEMGLYPFREQGEGEAKAAAWRQDALDRFAATYAAGQGGAEVVQGDIQPKRWKKLLWNAAWGGLCTLARQPVSEMLQDDNLTTTGDAVRKIMLEVLYVARACGYDEAQFPSKSVDEVFDLTFTQAPRFFRADGDARKPNLREDFKPSLLVDLEANRPMELSPIIGNIVKKAHAHRVDVPRLELIFAALHPSLMQAIHASAASASAGAR